MVVWQFGNETQRDIFVLVLRNGLVMEYGVNSEVWETHPRDREREMLQEYSKRNSLREMKELCKDMIKGPYIALMCEYTEQEHTNKNNCTVSNATKLNTQPTPWSRVLK
jgi:hypothetical protein